MAVASAGPYAIICTLLQTDNHANNSPLNFYRSDALPAAQPTVSKHCFNHLNNIMFLSHWGTYICMLWNMLYRCAQCWKQSKIYELRIMTNIVQDKEDCISGHVVIQTHCKLWGAFYYKATDSSQKKTEKCNPIHLSWCMINNLYQE